jgi:hypothetical protein
MTSGLRTANRARQVVQEIEKSAFSTVSPVIKSDHQPGGPGSRLVPAPPLPSRNCTPPGPDCHSGSSARGPCPSGVT